MTPIFLFFLLAGQPDYNYVPTDSRVYQDLEILKTSGLILLLPSTSRPWTRAECCRLYLQAESLARGRRLGALPRAALLRLRQELFARNPLLTLPLLDSIPPSELALGVDAFSRMRYEPGRARFSLGVAFDGRPADRLFFYEAIEPTALVPKEYRICDSAGWHNPGARSVAWRDLVLWQMERAYFGFQLPWLRLEFGRDEFIWGPGYRSSVMLSDSAPALDQVQFMLQGRRLKFLSFTALLSRWNGRHRFLSGQRLEVFLLNKLVLGGAMFNVYTFEDATDFTGMLNPLLPLYFSMANAGHGDNLLLGWDAVLYLPKTKVYGQLLLDNYEFNTRRDAPNCVGLQAGVYSVPALFEFRLEYTMITAFTYYHRNHSIMYENYSIPLGSELGPDADRVWALLSFNPVTSLKLGLAAERTRRGYYNRGDFIRKSFIPGRDTVFLRHYYRFPARGWDSTAADSEVETVFRMGPELEFDPLPRLYINARIQVAFYHCRDGLPLSDAVLPEFLLKLEYRY